MAQNARYGALRTQTTEVSPNQSLAELVVAPLLLPPPNPEKSCSRKLTHYQPGGAIDARLRFDYCAAMAKKKNTKNSEKNAFLGSLERLGGKKLTQRGAEESSRGRESRKHRVGSGGRKSG